jgi:hypothetical protein
LADKFKFYSFSEFKNQRSKNIWKLTVDWNLKNSAGNWNRFEFENNGQIYKSSNNGQNAAN